tara:strand:- start:269 stop:460 length:192 start_codon:yes stop_codon:yes gene_type:complete
MYMYTIIKESPDGAQDKIDYVVGTGDETLAELRALAEARLSELKAQSDNPEKITMRRRIVPGI